MKPLIAGLRLSHKFLLIGALAIAMLAMPTALLIRSNLESIHRARTEQEGLVPAHNVVRLIQLTQQHRGLTAAVLGGARGVADARTRKQAEVEEQLRTVGRTVKELGIPQLRSEIESIAEGMPPVLAVAATGNGGSAKESFTLHTALVVKELSLLEDIAAKSGLQLHPSVAGYYLQLAMVKHLPQLTEALGQLRGRGALMLAQHSASGEDKGRMAATADLAKTQFAAASNALAMALAADPALQRGLGAELATGAADVRLAIQLADEMVVESPSLDYPAPDYVAAMTKAIDPQFMVIDAAFRTMQAEIDVYVHSARFNLELIMGIMLAIVAVSIWVMVVVTHGITESVQSAVQLCERIADGHLDNPPDTMARAEMRQLMDGLGSMQVHLRDRKSADDAMLTQTRDAVTETRAVMSEMEERKEALDAAVQETQSVVQATLLGASDQRINVAGKTEQLETLAHTINSLIEDVVKSVGQTQRIVGSAMEGDLTQRIPLDGRTGHFSILAETVNALVANFMEVVHAIRLASAEVHSGADEISKGNADLSARTERQASSLEETAASMEQMTAAVKNSADNAAQASKLAITASDHASRGGAVVQLAIASMSEINSSSKKIVDIIGVIDSIAFQTNLLALNAAVEAARAGTQGRGFAVVASEVRNLAARSATAAKEISVLIAESVAKVNEGTKLVGASGKVLEEIVAGVKKVTDVVAEIAVSSHEQASGIDQVNRAVMSMDEGTQQNAALVEQAAAASQSLSDQAAGLTNMMARYRVLNGSAEGRADGGSIPTVNHRRPAAAA